MNDSQFDDFVNDRLGEYAAPVPAGLWEKVAEGQFDQFIGGKLKDHIAPVPEGLWDKITDGQFDQFLGNKLNHFTAPVPGGLWDKIADGQFDAFVAGKVAQPNAAVPAGLWDKVADGQFDAFVAGRVTNIEAPVPAGLWEKVRPQEEGDDRGAFWWFRYPAAAVLILALLTAGAVGGYIFLKNQKEDSSVVGQSSAINNPSTADGKNALPADQTQNNSSTVTDKPVTSAQPSPINNQSPANAEEIAGNRQAGSVREEKAAGLLGEKPAITVGAAVNQPGQNRLVPPSGGTTILTNPNEIFNSGKTVVVAQQDEPVSAKNSWDDFVIEPYQPGFTDAATVSMEKYNLRDLSNKQLSAGTRRFKSVIICPADKGKNTDWFLETYLSPDIALKSVSNVSASSLYMLKKDSAEHSRIGYSAGIRLVKPITDNILLKAGIQYTQANEKYIYRTENEVKTTTVVTVRTIIRAPGDTVIVNDTSILQTAGYKTNAVNNRYRSFDVPVTVGYQFGNEDLKFGINAGVVVNLTSWYQGMVLDSTLANVPLAKTGNGIYKTNIGLGLIGSISVVKRLSDDLHIFAEPYFRYNLSNMSTPQAGFSQRLSIGGLAVGLRFNLNRN